MFDFWRYIERHEEWSGETFGHEVPSPQSVTGHIRKELDEIMEAPDDLEEWVDVIILALDGAWRFAGATPKEITDALLEKQEKNERRVWGDPVRGEPTEHIKRGER